MDDITITDAALAARDGDRTAAARLVELTQQQVWHVLAHLTDQDAAADLAQETYERAFGALHRFRAESSAQTWLLAIVRRVAADHQRHRTHHPADPAPIHNDDEPLGTPRAGDLAEGIALRLALDALPAEQGEAFLLTQMLGLGYADAAEVAGCPIGTIRSRVARARAHLINALEDHPANHRAAPGLRRRTS